MGNPGAYFDDQRPYDVTNETYLDLCTPRDVCFLMRQLDMEFYLRARAGDMRQYDINGDLKTPISPATLTPVTVPPEYIDNSLGQFRMKADICKLKTQWYFDHLAAIAKGKNSTAKATATFS